MRHSHYRILIFAIIFTLKRGYSYQYEDKDRSLRSPVAFEDPIYDLSDDEPGDDSSLEEPLVRKSRASYLFRTRKDPNKKDRMYLFRTKKAQDEEEGRDRRDGGSSSSFFFRTRKAKDNFDRGTRGGYYFRTRRGEEEIPARYFPRARKWNGSSYLFRNRRDADNQKRSYFFRTRKLVDENNLYNFERSLRGRAYFLRT